MNEITINVKIEGLDQLTDVLALLTSGIAHTKGMTKTAEAVETIATEKVEEPFVADTKDITREEVRKMFLEKNDPTQRKKLKEILTKYNADNISSLAEEHFSDVMKDLEAI